MAGMFLNETAMIAVASKTDNALGKKVDDDQTALSPVKSVTRENFIIRTMIFYTL